MRKQRPALSRIAPQRFDDYDEGWDWETEQATYETDLVLVDRDTLVVKRVTFGNDTRILRDENQGVLS